MFQSNRNNIRQGAKTVIRTRTKLRHRKKNPKLYMEELIIDIENAITKLKPAVQNIYRYLATKKIKGIQESSMHNIKHKRRYTINNLKEILKRNNSTIIKVDKSKAIVIIKKDDSDQKIRAFIKQNKVQFCWYISV